MDRLTNKQKKILNKFLIRYYPLFFNTARRIVKTEDASSEVVQKSLLYIIEKIVEEKDIHNLVGYTIVAIRCRALNYIRDKKRIIYLEDQINPKIRKQF